MVRPLFFQQWADKAITEKLDSLTAALSSNSSHILHIRTAVADKFLVHQQHREAEVRLENINGPVYNGLHKVYFIFHCPRQIVYFYYLRQDPC